VNSWHNAWKLKDLKFYLKTAVSEMMEQFIFFSLRSFAKECPLKEGGFSVMMT
jgi:hypothetical protein